jgi:hypothetical protein
MEKGEKEEKREKSDWQSAAKEFKGRTKQLEKNPKDSWI